MEAKDVTVIQVISSTSGGGAEVLVRELHKRLPCFGINSQKISFSKGSSQRLEENEYSLEMQNPRSPLIIFRLRRCLKQIVGKDAGPVIVHSHLTWPFFYVPIASWGLRSTLVVTEHSTENRRRAFPVLSLVERFWYSRYRIVISITKSVRANLKDWLNIKSDAGKYVIVRNGARTFDPKPERDARATREAIRLVAVGSLNYRKGFDIALEALALCRSEVGCFTIVGEGPERAALAEQASRLGIDDIVHFVGWAEDVESYYHAADAALVSSRWEGFGLVAVEGLSTGLPLICPDVAGLSEVVDGCASVFMFSSQSAESMAREIERLTARIMRGDDFSAAAIQHAQQFDLAEMASRYADIYRQLI